ncbi:hydroxymethylglutaryl-CoA lyase [Alicyclobacillus sp. SP_1]|jgi:hydroxymethylglutaryl-CoA lyase|uniref:hydroxymethylglutaryl-CoA lyase n=1 Tax=Alicyclobacillus sp. SP_1 TaxID=2942475 RepID=UPI0021582070|nr:hydroxymethylglutaryl-CoA lyase [Alicyclobacillus sp. SP_1]
MTTVQASTAQVTLFEVGPRDGLQNEPETLATEVKVELLERLMESGLTRIEVSSFVSPKWIPQLADASEVFQRMRRRRGVELSALVPNLQGLERALAADVDSVGVFMSASEAHNQKNINKTRAETYPVLAPVVTQALQAKKQVRGYVSTAFGCPYEGAVNPLEVVDVALRLLDMGIQELSIGDTIGVAVPTQVERLLAELDAKDVPMSQIALHFHDTRGMAIANAYAGYRCGVRTFDGSIGGLGGCPYAKGASGNVATEDLFYLFDGMGVAPAVSIATLRSTAAWLEQKLGRKLESRDRRVVSGEEGETTV